MLYFETRGRHINSHWLSFGCCHAMKHLHIFVIRWRHFLGAFRQTENHDFALSVNISAYAIISSLSQVLFQSSSDNIICRFAVLCVFFPTLSLLRFLSKHYCFGMLDLDIFLRYETLGSVICSKISAPRQIKNALFIFQKSKNAKIIERLV